MQRTVEVGGFWRSGHVPCQYRTKVMMNSKVAVVCQRIKMLHSFARAKACTIKKAQFYPCGSILIYPG